MVNEALSRHRVSGWSMWKMGSEVVRAVTSQGDMELVGAVDVVNCQRTSVSSSDLGLGSHSLNLTECLKQSRPLRGRFRHRG